MQNKMILWLRERYLYELISHHIWRARKLKKKITMTFCYTNYRGETGDRIVRLDGATLDDTPSDYHVGANYILRAIDVNKQERREFAIRDIKQSRKILFKMSKLP